jgi:hypothetical protein
VKPNCDTLGKKHLWRTKKGGTGSNPVLSEAIPSWRVCANCGWATAPLLQERGWLKSECKSYQRTRRPPL